ncbi:MAG TPA: hypothetical protein ENL03_01160, partial [Phycisphaerae bacterium]|nr:hypothetical protein [Phycisphaerae bacterium]
MHTLRMPALAGDIKDATVRRWLRSPGESVEKGQLLLIAEAISSNIEIASPITGTLTAIEAQAGTTCQAGASLAVISEATDQTKPTKVKQDMPKNNTPTSSDDSIALLLPQMGNSMEEGTIVKWRVSEGDEISVGQVIYDLETDKAVVEVEADVAGKIAKIVAPEGEITPIKEVVAYLGSAPAGAEAVPAPTAAASPAPPAKLAKADGITALLLPQMGNSMEEGTIVTWRVAEGDSITVGQIVYDL